MRLSARFALAVLIILSSVTVGHAIPQLINYQGLLIDGSGTPITVPTTVEFRIWDASAAGTELWMESQSVTPGADGLFNVLLGSVTPIPDAALASAAAYLGLTISPDPEATPRTQLVAVAYAFRAGTVDGATGGAITGNLSITGEATIGTGHGASGGEAFVAGRLNTAGGFRSTVSGGSGNAASGGNSVIGGGAGNDATGNRSTVAGGHGNIASGDSSFVGGGSRNTASGTHSTIPGGAKNAAAGDYSHTVGYADSISATADYSVLFGINGNLTADSTFMVDMPHIRFGDETDGYEIPPTDGSTGQVLQTDGSGQASWSTLASGGSGWADDGTVVRLETTSDSVGIGTSTPTEKLDVAGNIHASGTIASGSSIVIDGVTDKITATSGTIDFDDENLVTTGKANIGPGNTNTGTNAFVTGANNVASGQNATIGGGSLDTASGIFSTIAGGNSNTASLNGATIGGGIANAASGLRATIVGGWADTASGNYSAIVSGRNNTASGDSSFVGGGSRNHASGLTSTVSGGHADTALGTWSTVAGGGYNTANSQRSTISGGSNNTATGNATTIGGGYQNIAYGNEATVGGGYNNSAVSHYCTASGGWLNVASDQFATVGGGFGDTASGLYSAVGGGNQNVASGSAATVGGGGHNWAKGNYSSVGGGRYSSAHGRYSAVSGGFNNTAGGDSSFVGGGSHNHATTVNATVSGGYADTADGYWSTVGGGSQNTASGTYATVGGGGRNRASGYGSTVPGGFQNAAYGYYSLAAGVSAKARHSGTVVLSANSLPGPADSVYSTGNEQMVLRADGHFYLTDAAGGATIPGGDFLNTSTGAHLTTGGVWTNSSDRNKKENFAAVDQSELLEKIAQLSISRWNYKGESETVQHIGPVAQDFYAAFGVGTDDKSISTIDPAGIALAGIQALYQRTEALTTAHERIDKLASENEELRSELRELRQMIERAVNQR